MADHISREAVLADLSAAAEKGGMGQMIADTMIRYVKRQPAADVEPVRHGRWIGLEYDGYADGNPVYNLWECSECGEEVRGESVPETHLFCPNCGAKMDGGAEDG